MRTWYTERLKARFSTLFRNSESSCSDAKGDKPAGKVENSKSGVTEISVWPAKLLNYGIANMVFFFFLFTFGSLECDNSPCSQKANGFWSGVLFNAPMALTLSSDVASKEFTKGHPRFFVREIHKGSSWKFQNPTPIRHQ